MGGNGRRKGREGTCKVEVGRKERFRRWGGKGKGKKKSEKGEEVKGKIIGY